MTIVQMIVVAVAAIETLFGISTVIVVSAVIHTDFTLIYVDAFVTCDASLMIILTMTATDGTSWFTGPRAIKNSQAKIWKALTGVTAVGIEA